MFYRVIYKRKRTDIVLDKSKKISLKEAIDLANDKITHRPIVLEELNKYVICIDKGDDFDYSNEKEVFVFL